MIRWKGLIFIAVLFGIFFLLTMIFKDSWLETRIEHAGNSVVGAKVEIDDLDFSLFGLHVRWDRLQVTNPQNTMQNLFETGFCEFNMETWPLFSGKVIIDNLEMSDFRTGTERERDGALPKPQQQEQQKEPGFLSKSFTKLSDQVASNVTMNVSAFSRQFNVDSLMNLVEIRSIDKIDSLRTSLQSRYNQWEQRLSKMDYREEISQIESDLRSLNTRQLETVAGIKDAITTVTQTQNRLEEIRDEIQSAKKDLTSDLREIPGTLDTIDTWITADYQRIKSKARLPDISPGNISRLIFGDKLVNQYTKYAGYVGTARNYFNRLKADNDPEKQSPPRMEGQDIHFYNKNARPRFWIKRISLSGVTGNQLPVRGEVTNIVSDQRLIGNTTDIVVESLPESGTSFLLEGTLNYLDDSPSESFELRYAGFSLKNSNLSTSPLLPNRVSEGTGTMESSLAFQEDSFNSTIRFHTDNIRFAMRDRQQKVNQLERIVQSIVEGINTLEFTARITAENDQTNLSIDSNLDELFADNLRSTVLKEVERARSEIRSRIETKVKDYRTELRGLVDQREAELRAQLEKYEQRADEVRDRLEERKKELEQEIEQRKSQLQEEGMDRLKDLFD